MIREAALIYTNHLWSKCPKGKFFCQLHYSRAYWRHRMFNHLQNLK